MPKPKNVMEVFKLLDKSNCMQCGEKTCLAFAGAIFKEQKLIEECPKLDRETIQRIFGTSAGASAEKSVEENRDDYLKKLKNEIVRLDLAQAAGRAGASFSDKRLTLRILGKNFSVDTEGNLASDIHINPWVATPFLSYLLYGKGLAVSGTWVSFRDLKQGKERYPLFQKRCEEPIKQVADTYTDLFDDMVHIFAGKPVDKQFKSDISIVLYPLPKLPVMICYWLPEEGLESSLNIFFDKTADENLDIGSIFSLGAGLAQMFGKLALRHGIPCYNGGEQP